MQLWNIDFLSAVVKQKQLFSWNSTLLHISGGHSIKNIEQEGTVAKKNQNLQLFHRALSSQQLWNIVLMNMNDA